MKRTQEQKIIRALEKGAKLTPLDALSRFGCFRLASRISAIRKQGFEIEVERVKRGGAIVARYSMP